MSDTHTSSGVGQDPDLSSEFSETVNIDNPLHKKMDRTPPERDSIDNDIPEAEVGLRSAAQLLLLGSAFKLEMALLLAAGTTIVIRLWSASKRVRHTGILSTWTLWILREISGRPRPLNVPSLPTPKRPPLPHAWREQTLVKPPRLTEVR